MNDDQIPNEELPKPKRIRRTKPVEILVNDDPYADDFEWNADVNNISEPANTAPYVDPYAEPTIEGMIDPTFGPDQPLYMAERSAEQAEFEDRERSPLFQPDIVPNFVPEPFTPESTDETVRRSGLAYSIGIVFVVSVAFMLLLGWIADWMFGTKPWGLVGGIVFGSIIGFVQVVRISARIFTPNKNGPAVSPLMSHATNDEQMEPSHQDNYGEPAEHHD